MTVLTILHHPDPRLRQVALPVTIFDVQLATFAEDLLTTMYQAKGIGLAATQVGVRLRVIALDISEERNQGRIFINPEILSAEGSSVYEEGCLSLPDSFEKVTRPAKIHLRYQNLQGETQTLTAEGLLATCLQHEIDHLDGKLFIDYLSALKRERIQKRLEKRQRHAAA
jgi:peptide deformylase